MELQARAFTPKDAQEIAIAVHAEAADLVNRLSAIARSDGLRYAQDDLDLALNRLKLSRLELTNFRINHQMIDASSDVEGHMVSLNKMKENLSSAVIELEILSETYRSDDPRIPQAKRRIDVIKESISKEKLKISGAKFSYNNGESYAESIAEFERLMIDRDFSERSYLSALSAFDVLRSEVNRKSRYLATYIHPKVPEKYEFPQRGLLSVVLLLFLFLVWSALSLIYYAVRDRGEG